MDLPTPSYNRLRCGIGSDHSDSSSPTARELTLSSWPRRPTRNVAKGGDGSIQRAHLTNGSVLGEPPQAVRAALGQQAVTPFCLAVWLMR
jgi:hypothetical protein